MHIHLLHQVATGTPSHVPQAPCNNYRHFSQFLNKCMVPRDWPWNAFVVPISDLLNWRFLQFFRPLDDSEFSGRNINSPRWKTVGWEKSSLEAKYTSLSLSLSHSVSLFFILSRCLSLNLCLSLSLGISMWSRRVRGLFVACCRFWTSLSTASLACLATSATFLAATARALALPSRIASIALGAAPANADELTSTAFDEASSTASAATMPQSAGEVFARRRARWYGYLWYVQVWFVVAHSSQILDTKSTSVQHGTQACLCWTWRAVTIQSQLVAPQ